MAQGRPPRGEPPPPGDSDVPPDVVVEYNAPMSDDEIMAMGYTHRDATGRWIKPPFEREPFDPGHDYAHVGERGNGDGSQITGLRDRMIRGDEFVLDAPDKLPLIWGDDDNAIWAEGQSLEPVGPIGVGKTTIAAQLVRARLGLDDQVLGFPVRAGRRNVLYLACDRAPQIAQAFHRTATEDERAVLHDRLLVWRGPPPADLAKHPEMLLELAHAADADTVVVDSLKDVAVGLATDEGGAGLNNAIQIALVAGVEVIALHHQRKGQEGKKPKTLEDVYGSTWITAGAGSVLLLWGEPGDQIVELSQLKPLAIPVGPWTLEHDHDAGTSSILTGAADPLVMLRHAPDGLTAEDVARVQSANSKPTRNEKAKARQQLKRLETKQLAYRKDSEHGPARYYATPLTDQPSEP